MTIKHRGLVAAQRHSGCKQHDNRCAIVAATHNLHSPSSSLIFRRVKIWSATAGERVAPSGSFGLMTFGDTTNLAISAVRILLYTSTRLLSRGFLSRWAKILKLLKRHGASRPVSLQPLITGVLKPYRLDQELQSQPAARATEQKAALAEPVAPDKCKGLLTFSAALFVPKTFCSTATRFYSRAGTQLHKTILNLNEVRQQELIINERRC